MASSSNDGAANKKFAVFVILWQILMILLFAGKVEYATSASPQQDTSSSPLPIHYALFQDVHVMIFVGFGFLMTFLRRYSYGAVGFNFVIAAMCLQWAVLVMGFWHRVQEKDGGDLRLDLFSLVNGDFAAGSVLITFGGVLGKTNAFQMVVIAFIEIIFFGLNEMILIKKLHIADIGGSMVIHVFGAYFGLSLALVLGPRVAANQKANGHSGSSHLPPSPSSPSSPPTTTTSSPPHQHPYNNSNKTFDTTAMIGTLFLWLFWPSFNAAISDGSRQQRAILNTVLSLCASCGVAFSLSALLREKAKFSMVDVQNATLAGGVAAGAIADMAIQPWGALLNGFCAGAVSTFGFCVLQSLLADKISLYDTCGIHNLHGMPGVIGGIGSAIAAAAATKSTYGDALYLIFPERAPSDEATAAMMGLDPGSSRTAIEQGGFQFAALLVTLGIAIFTGTMTGFLVRTPFFEGPTRLFDDVEYWHVEQHADEEANFASGKNLVSASSGQL